MSKLQQHIEELENSGNMLADLTVKEVLEILYEIRSEIKTMLNRTVKISDASSWGSHEELSGVEGTLQWLLGEDVDPPPWPRK